MKHHGYNLNFEFVKEPIEFNKYTDRELLQYCLGATLYMPGTKDIKNAILNKKLKGLTSMVLCCEDAIDEKDLPEAEENIIDFLEFVYNSIEDGKIERNDLPLFFIRVRSVEQFIKFSNNFDEKHIEILTGINFPEFSTNNGYEYLEQLKRLNEKFGEILYGMPILEGREIAYKEARTHELMGLKNLLKPYKDLILNIRVGATDFSSIFGVRRGIDYTVYDIMTVRDCLSDILNYLNRDGEDYVLSGPVWEYFLADKTLEIEDSIETDIHTSLMKRDTLINEATDGLLREVILDKANGFVGKTIIHPSHIKYVNAMQAVTKEEYEDAKQVLDTSGGVVKSSSGNKMNEINPHRSWAKKINAKAKAYGVIENEEDYIDLFS